ncbi:MAG: FAD-dependent oxidoreductase [Candidatus Omnitrophica bacterium]|nr:FAD-dependent oxidoreductase [Candidatus Omnitrophota bacterium]MCM8802912.1 FAD-dependent oxidoreductase [Candidatus Omnitrophota bacterium]
MEKVRKIGKYDVVVVGGGIAGVSASISSARNGMKVCLIEKFCALGGLATIGNVCVYLPLCDGKGNQTIGGLAEELLKLSISDGYKDIPQAWKEKGDIKKRKETRYKVEFNPVSFMLLLEELVLKEGVEIRYDTRFCGVIKENNEITHLIIEDKEGKGIIECKVVVDASGDADVCYFSGEDIVSVDANVPVAWFFCFDGKEVKRYVVGERYDPYNRDVKGFSVNTVKEITEQIIKSREYIRRKIEQLKGENPHIYPVSIPLMPTFRMTRRLKGKIELREEDEGKIFPDAVGMTGDWRRSGPIYYIPFSCLYGVKTKNLTTAGRCISASSAWDIIRAIPCCALTGEISGTASSLLIKEKAESFSNLDIKKLQKILKKQGVII